MSAHTLYNECFAKEVLNCSISLKRNKKIELLGLKVKKIGMKNVPFDTEKPYQCPVYDQNFSDSNVMKNHNILEQSVFSSENVDIHDINHKISNFILDCVCIICEHECENKVEIINHVKKEHLEIISEENGDKILRSEAQPDEEPISAFYHPREMLEVYDKSDSEIPNDSFKVEIKPKKHKCTKCDVTFTEKGNMNAHVRSVHEGKKPYKCSLCDYSAAHKPNLDRHKISVHETDLDKKRERLQIAKKHECVKCSLKYGSKGELTRHVNEVHEGKKPNKCTQCGKCFSRKPELNRHITVIHEKKKPFKCDICNQAFARKDMVKSHFATVHNGEKQYKCPLCDNSYSSQTAVIHHMGIIHDQNPYDCRDVITGKI